MPEQWTLRAVAGPTPATVGFADIPALVPGCAHTDLLAAGLIADPYLHDQENRLRWIGHTDWQYSTTFGADPVRPGEQVELVFEGLDTVATVELNGRQIARTRNMHRSYRLDVGEYLRPEANVLTVLFASPIEAAERFSSELGPAAARESPSGYQVRVMAVRLIKDLALLADRIDPGARVDEQLVTLLPGETITFTVAGRAGLDRAAFTDPRVLRSANQLKGSAHAPISGVRPGS